VPILEAEFAMLDTGTSLGLFPVNDFVSLVN